MSECIFCRIAARALPAWVVYETEATIAFFDIHPMNPYHTLVIPRVHYPDIFTIPIAVLQEVTAAAKHVVDLYHARLGLQHVQLISSNGPAAQQDVFHFHMHIAPRHAGDGQDTSWKTTSTLTAQFDQMLRSLRADDT